MNQYVESAPVGARRLDAATWTVLVGSAALLIGSVLPWAKVVTIFGSISIDGTAGDGKITLVAALAAGALVGFGALGRAEGRVLPVLALLAGLAAAGTGIYDTARAQQAIGKVARESEGVGQLQIGIGLWLVDAASIAVIVGAVLMIGAVSRRQTVQVRPLSAAPVSTYVAPNQSAAPWNVRSTAAPRPAPPASVPAQRPAPGPAQAKPAPAAVVRAWAVEHGLDVKPQGPIPRQIREQYAAATAG